jgi:hypothetical protein
VDRALETGYVDVTSLGSLLKGIVAGQRSHGIRGKVAVLLLAFSGAGGAALFLSLGLFVAAEAVESSSSSKITAALVMVSDIGARSDTFRQTLELSGWICLFDRSIRGYA